MYFVSADRYGGQQGIQKQLDVPDNPDDNEFAEFGLYATRLKIPDDSLPIRKDKTKILKTITDNRVCIVMGSTGSGKSTIIPAYLLASSRTDAVKMAVTQPRRVAAIKLCERLKSFVISSENTSGSKLIGFGIRGWRAYDASTKIKFVTTGYLQRILAYRPHSITDYSHVLLDEVHERSIDSDFLCLIVKILMQLPQNRHMRLVVMSATLQASLYQEFFTVVNLAKVPHTLSIDSGNKYKVQKVYLEQVIRFLPDNLKWTHGQALSQFIVDANASSGGARAEFTDDIRNLLVELVLRYTHDGQTTLVFLPGHGETVHVTEILEMELIKKKKKIAPVDDIEEYLTFTRSFSDTKSFYEIFALHGMMPQSQMKLPLQKPPPKARRIILATNVAETSLTVANVAVVIDTGLRKISKYDYQGGFSRLVNTWCSKASITQRLGRAGRVCDGTCFRLFTREWEERVMVDYDAPDSAVDNFSNVLLFSKLTSENFSRLGIIPSNKPSYLIQQLPDPPDANRIDDAILTLHQFGLTWGELSETAPLTILGMMASRLQVDVVLSRLIYYAWMMGTVIDGIVLAAACSLERDMFRSPKRFSQGNETKFAKESRKLLKLRDLYDNGAMSEPIAYRNLMLAWIYHRSGKHDKKIPEFRVEAIFKSEFETFKCLCESIAERFQHFLEEDLGLPSMQDIAIFGYILNSFSARQGEDDEGVTPKGIEDGLVASRIPFLMTSNVLNLKFLLLVALNRRIFHASAKSENQDPTCCMSFKMTNQEDESIDKHFLVLKQTALQLLVSRLTGTTESWGITFKRDEVRAIPDVTLETSNCILAPEAVRVASQFFDRRRVPFRLGEDEDSGIDDFICLHRPRVVNIVNWNHVTTVRDSRMKTRRSSIRVRFNFRSPVAYLMHSTRASQTHDYWAVASCIQGSSTSPNKDGVSWLTETRADCATILPTEFGGSLALVMLLVCLPFRTSGLEALVSIDEKTNDYRIRKLCFDGKWISVHPLYPITNAILSQVSNIRDLIIQSTAVGRDQAGDISDALRRIRMAQTYLPGSLSRFFSVCNDWFSTKEPEPQVSWCQKIVKLVDVSNGPHLLIDSRLWIGRNEPENESLFDNPSNGEENTLTPEELRVARDRMRYIGYSQREVDSCFPIW